MPRMVAVKVATAQVAGPVPGTTYRLQAVQEQGRVRSPVPDCGWTCLEQAGQRDRCPLGPRPQGGEPTGPGPHPLPACPCCWPRGFGSLLAKLHLASLLCRYFNYADMFLDSFKYVYYLLIRP